MDDVNIKYVGGNWYKGTYKNYEFEAKVFKDCVETSKNIMNFTSEFSTHLELYIWHIKYAKADKNSLENKKEE